MWKITTMNQEQAKARARALLDVIETMYEIRITNSEQVIEAITEKTLDEQKILTISTSLNSWVAILYGQDSYKSRARVPTTSEYLQWASCQEQTL